MASDRILAIGVGVALCFAVMGLGMAAFVVRFVAVAATSYGP